MRPLRFGVDVGGTFTDVVAVDGRTRELIAQVKVPTTHDAPEGVAAGIVAGIARLLHEANVSPNDVAFIAHSTTQATNALLEGDVARVGVLGLRGRGGWLARAQMRFKPVALAPGVTFAPAFAFARSGGEPAIVAALDNLRARGVEAIAATEAFSVDRPAGEARVVDLARERGLFATAGSDVSALYGLRARTRTAAINAAILPKMVRTARMTAAAVTQAGIAAPLMIMRSDGGVMDVREVERRPILTMLSGPAAGVAGALLYENVTDGIFVEVGGTSADCCAIRNGRPQMHPARIGGHRTMLRTIDSRTIGIAGGSIPQVDGGRIVNVGPRSAHIAGCGYAAFLSVEAFDGARIERFAPTPHDAPNYLRFALRGGTFATVTPTCASNLLGFAAGSFAAGNVDAARRAFELLADELGGDPERLARDLLEIAARKVRACVEELARDYELALERIELVGGGGGAAALVPFVAHTLGLTYRIARDAQVISPIGVALALVRDVVERTISDPTAEDIAAIRREAADRVVAAGASPERIEVSVEIDAQRSRVRATASGATAMADGVAGGAAALNVEVRGHEVRVVDERGVVRLSLQRAAVREATAGSLEREVRDAMEEATSFGDVGRALPAVYLVHGGRIADFSGLASVDQAVALALEEVNGRDSVAPVWIITVRTQA